MSSEKDNKLALFEGRQIRKAFHEGEWWFSIIDVVEVLVGSDRPRKYWNDLKKKITAEGYFEVSEKIGQFKRARRGLLNQRSTLPGILYVSDFLKNGNKTLHFLLLSFKM